jgi:hypothetical protein
MMMMAGQRLLLVKMPHLTGVAPRLQAASRRTVTLLMPEQHCQQTSLCNRQTAIKNTETLSRQLHPERKRHKTRL